MGTDVWKAPNSVEVCGIIMYWLEVEKGTNVHKLKSVPWDFVL
jgi:hypothetical protein